MHTMNINLITNNLLNFFSMKRNFIYMLSLLLIAGGFSACKRVESVQKESSKVTVYKDGTIEQKYYKLIPPEQDREQVEEAESPKYLCSLTARYLLRKQLKKENMARLTAPVRIGYYECNNYSERLKLMKLAANNIIKLQCDEIVTEFGPTYWVTVDLTWKGWWLRESPKKPVFPEDRITEEEAKAFLIPELDQDPWGVPTTDTLVPVQIKEAMKTFYAGLQAGQSYNQSLMDAKMVCAMRLLNTLASYGVDKLGNNPFTRDVELTPEMVQNMTVLRMPRMQNAYLVSIGGNDFLYVVSAENPVVIEDLAYLAPDKLRSLKQTVCSLAGTLTKEEILAAREAKRQRDKIEEQLRQAMARMPQRPAPQPEEDEDDFEMCETSGSLAYVEHSDPTLYELAKEKEHFETVKLLGGVVRVSAIDDIDVHGNQKEAWATATATYKLCRVNGVGRVYLGLTNGEKEENHVTFNYTRKNGWRLAE